MLPWSRLPERGNRPGYCRGCVRAVLLIGELRVVRPAWSDRIEHGSHIEYPVPCEANQLARSRTPRSIAIIDRDLERGRSWCGNHRKISRRGRVGNRPVQHHAATRAAGIGVGKNGGEGERPGHVDYRHRCIRARGATPRKRHHRARREPVSRRRCDSQNLPLEGGCRDSGHGIPVDPSQRDIVAGNQTMRHGSSHRGDPGTFLVVDDDSSYVAAHNRRRDARELRLVTDLELMRRGRRDRNDVFLARSGRSRDGGCPADA